MSNLKNEMEQLFVLNCTLRQTNKMIMSDKQQQQNVMQMCRQNEHNNTELLNNLDNLKPSCSIKIDPTQTDIDLLLEAM